MQRPLTFNAVAVLKGSANIVDYQFFKAPNFPGSTHDGISYTDQAQNVSITGLGAIDRNEQVFLKWNEAKTIQWGGTENTRKGKNFRKPLSGISDGPVVSKKRPSKIIIFPSSKIITIENAQLLKFPFWTLHIADSEGVTISGIKIHSSRLTSTRDGIDITSSQNETPFNCDICTGDGAIAIKGYAHYFELPLVHSEANPG